MEALGEASRDNAGRRGKIRCHPQIAFVRENLLRRVARRSLQFSAPTFGCKRRAPTNEGCRRWCPVHPDAWPDSREFPAPEMEAKARQAHIGDVSRPSVAIDVPEFPLLWGQHQLRASGGLASFNSSSENALGREALCPCPNAHSAVDSSAPVRTILSYHPGEYSLPISW